MAITASNFSVVHRAKLGFGAELVRGTFTGPSSYTASGETLTDTLCSAIFGFNDLHMLIFQPAVRSTFFERLDILFDHNESGTNKGKIHFHHSGHTAHTHSIIVSGGISSGDIGNFVFIVPVAGTTILGKAAASDATATGGTTNNIITSTGIQHASEIAGTTDLSTYTCRFIAIGQ